MSEQRKIRLTLSPQAERYARRDAPVEVRRMAARGALPLPPIELATVLFALLHDPDDETKSRARESLEALPEPVLGPVLTGDTHPAVLSYLAQLHRDHADRLEKIALNAAADDETIALLASLPHRRVVEIVALNQERMLRCPDIVDALGQNPATSRSTIDRILSFLGVAKPQAEVEDGEEPDAVAVGPVGDVTDDQALAALRAVLGDDASNFLRELVEDREGELDEEALRNLWAHVQHLSVTQKVKLARLGNREARALLVRDKNRIVAAAAIRSPKITQQEVEGFAKARNLAEEPIRILASNREWTRSYSVKLALATNPKCPRPIAMKFLNYLQERDLRQIMKSKDVPAVVAQHARRLLSKKGK